MSVTHYFTFQRGWKFLQQSFLILKWSYIFVIILKETFDSLFKNWWQPNSLSIILEGIKFLFQNSIFRIHTCDDWGEVTNGEGVETHTEDHPEDGENLLGHGGGGDVTVAYCCDGLQGPVGWGKVLIAIIFILDAPNNNPAIRFKVIELGWEEPETGHQMHHEEHTSCDLDHTHHTLV